MTLQTSIEPQQNAETSLPIEQVTQLYTVLGLIEKMGRAEVFGMPVPDEAMVIRAYEQASGVAQRRFRSIASDAAIASAEAANALVNCDGDVSSAAQSLAGYMRRALCTMGETVGLES